MIILKCRCGLGNQLFEYAFARWLMHEKKEEHIYLSLHAYKKEPDGRTSELQNFRLPDDTSALPKWKDKLLFYRYRILGKLIRIKAARMGRPENEELLKAGIYNANYEMMKMDYQGKRHYLQGIFQNYHYFPGMESELRQIYQLNREAPNQENKDMLKRIRETEAVCVHIRRGDFVSNLRWNRELYICTEKYYLEGMKYMKNFLGGGTEFYIFSNSHEDLEDIRRHFNFPWKVTYVDLGNEACDDFRLMCACKHFVISNSSFSWWAQYLSTNQEKIVVAPAYWDASKGRYNGIYQDNWVLINPEEV